MKKLSVLFTAVLLFVAASTVSAQKVASLDVNAILNLMPEKKKADETLEALSKTKGAEIEKRRNDAEALYKKYQEEAPKQTQQVNEQRGAELQKAQEQIQALMQAAQKDIAEKTDAAYAPIEKKFQAAVDKVAKANGYDFVLDGNSNVLIYKGGADATPAVKKELGL